MRAEVWVVLAALLGIPCCGLLESATGPEDIQKRSLVVLQPADGWEGAVRIDSVTWLPAFAGAGYDPDPGEVDGVFAARFQNLGARPLRIRYELRFYDPDGFLLDTFFPFQQPLDLTAHEIRWVRAEFRLDLTSAAAEWLASMELVARIQAPGS